MYQFLVHAYGMNLLKNKHIYHKAEVRSKRLLMRLTDKQTLRQLSKSFENFTKFKCLASPGAFVVRALRHRTSETSVNFYVTTRRSITEGCHLHACRRKCLKFHRISP
jgi:hypothetical protein